MEKNITGKKKEQMVPAIYISIAYCLFYLFTYLFTLFILFHDH